MSIFESRETSGMARPPVNVTERADMLCGVQEARREPDATAEVGSERATEDELPVRRSGQLFAVPQLSPEVEGFLPNFWKPEPYQERGVEWLATRPAAALFLPPGMGKTSISLAAVGMVGELLRKRIRTLVIAPLTVCLTTWQTEPAKWRQFSHLKVGLAHGSDKELILKDDYYDIVVINYDGIAWMAPILASGHNFDILLCDELTRLKHTTSKRFKTLKPLLSSFSFRWGLTGTPAANGLMDLFGQCYVLDMGKRLGKFITHFRLKYFYQKAFDQYRYFIRDVEATQLVEKISDMAMYLDPKDYLTLPPLIDVPLEVEFSKHEMGQYKVLEDDFILKLQDNIVTAANAGVLTSKLRQFTGGAVYSSTGVYDVVSRAKIDRLESLVEELAGEPLMVAYQFEHEYERLIRLFPDACAIRGGMSKNKLSETVEVWNQGQTPVLLVQPTAAALGLNLQFGGSAICWFSLTFNLEEYIQLIARLLRRGQTKSVMNYILAVKGTIDQHVAKVMVDKDATQNSVFEELKRLGTSTNKLQQS